MMNLPRPLICAGVALIVGLLAACNLAPRYARPPVEAPDRFKEAPSVATSSDGVAWSAAQPADALSRGRWWEPYHDAQLDALEAQVQVSNQDIRAAEANFRAARAAAGLARATLFPALTVDPAVTRSHASRSVENSSGSLPSANGPAAIDTYSLPFEASYEFDLWGRVRNGARAAAANAQASAADLATATLSLQAELAQDYFQVRALDTQRQIMADTVASYRHSLQQTQTLFRSGIDSEEEVARAETQLNSAVAQATDLGVARSAYEHAIAVLIGKPPARFSLPAAPLQAQPPPIPAGLPTDLLERRPDIAAAERRVAAANAQIGIARAAWFPRLTLGASAGWQSTDASQWFNWPSRFWSVGPQLAAAVFDGGGRRAQTDEARALFDAAAANYRETVLNAFQTVEDNLAAVRILEQEAGQQRIAVSSAQHLLDLANTRFQLGIDSYLNVITAQTALLSNRQAEVQIQLRRMLASIALVRAIGGGWDVARLPAVSRAPLARSP